MKRYVVGFMMDKGKVLLIRKKRPEWQRGFLNGVGGQVEIGETVWQAMVREFKEETGLETFESDWNRFVVLTEQRDPGGDESEVTFFYTAGPLWKCKTQTDEELEVRFVRELYLDNTVMYNLAWLFHMLRAHRLEDVEFYEVKYNRRTT